MKYKLKQKYYELREVCEPHEDKIILVFVIVMGLFVCYLGTV
jgi:hypothetical protein